MQRTIYIATNLFVGSKERMLRNCALLCWLVLCLVMPPQLEAKAEGKC